MIWSPNQAKGAVGAGFSGASARRLAASMAASAEDMADMAPLWGVNWTVFVMHSPCVSGIYMR